MSGALVSDKLWEIVEPLLPPEPPRPKGGRPRIPNRAALEGIIYVLKSGMQEVSRSGLHFSMSPVRVVSGRKPAT